MDRKCPKCGAVVSEGAKFCPKCGSGIPQEQAVKPQTRFCPHCGASIEADASFCGACGQAVQGGQTASSPGVSAAAASVVYKQSGGTDEIQDKIKDFFSTKGRLGRQAFCIRLIINFGCLMGVYILADVFEDVTALGTLMMILFGACFIASAVAFMTLSIRRCHDLGKSGWMALVQFVPLVGAFYQIYLMVAKGTPGPNAYGEDPLAQ